LEIVNEKGEELELIIDTERNFVQIKVEE